MKVFLNDKILDVEVSYLIEVLIQNNIKADKKGIAVAVNSYIVQRNNWEHYQLKENDKIFVITAAQGG